MHPVRSAPVKATAALARQLELLCADFRDAEQLATGLSELGASVAVAVPSCVSVSVMLGVLGSDTPVTVGIRGKGVGPVLASLAVPRSVSEPGDFVLFQASEAGAFLLLADDLRAVLDPSLSLWIDEHLHVPVDAMAGGWRRSMRDSSMVNRALGVLIDRGFLPDDAYAELTRQASQDGTNISSASRLVLESVEGPPGTLHE
jgi:hypothetical protein